MNAEGRSPSSRSPVDLPLLEARFERGLGSHGSPGTGPCLIVVGGIHGNEPAGVHAARRVLATLREREIPLHGRIVALAGNVGALEADLRFLDRDLNRMWTDESLAGLAARDPSRDAACEEMEQRGLRACIEDEIRKASRSPVLFLDLHSTSAGGAPFSVISDTLQNRRIAFTLGIPVILGLEEILQGAMLGHFADRGFTCIGVEGGQHNDPRTVDHLEAVLWVTLAAAGMLEETAVADLDAHRARLREASRGLPSVVEMIHRHAIGPEDRFRVEPGFHNFQAVLRGQIIGRDRFGEVRAESGGLLLMPLYQGQGEDGYFLGREVRPFWLELSRVLRRLGWERGLALLPGVRRRPGSPGALIVNPGIARFLVVEIFHVFGYRRCRPEGGKLVFTRRPEAQGLSGRFWK